MSGWRQVALRHLSREWCDGPFGSGIATEHYRDAGARVVRLQNIRAGAFDDRDEAFLDEDYFRASLTRHNVLAGDVLIAGLGDDNNLVGRACVAPAGLGLALVKADCFRFRVDRANADPRFVAYALSSSAECAAGELANGSTRQRINLSSMAGRTLLAPDTHEQERIANFLDEKTARIDALIAEKEHLHLQVSAYRAAKIEAVVAGKMEPGGRVGTRFDFCPEIPDGWVMRRLKHTSPEIVVGIVVNPSDYYSDNGRPFVFGGDIREDGLKAETTRRISKAGNAANQKSRLSSGDLVTVRVGEPGVTAVVPAEFDGANCASVMLTRGAPSFNSSWLAACMNSTIGRHQVKLVEYGAAMKQFNISHAREFWFPTPPLTNQNAIANDVAQINLRTRDLLSHAVEHIDRLREYRSSLISAAVTGQMDLSTFKVAA